MKNTFTFVIPVHNGLPYIKECLESLLAQDYKHFNVIVLENASDDGTKEYLYSLNNQKIQIIESNELLPMEKNWARILQAPKNEFMIIMCADDVYKDNYLSEINALINKNPEASIYRTQIAVINSDSEIMSYPKIKKNRYSEEEYLEGRLSNKYFSTIMGYCFRSKDYEEIGGIDCVHNLLHPDDVMVMKLARKSYLAISPVYASLYRSHALSTSTNPNAKIALEGYNYFMNWIFEQNNPKLNKIVKKYLPSFNYKNAKFFPAEMFSLLESVYPKFKIDKNSLFYKFNLFKTKISENIYVTTEIDRVKIQIFSFKTYIKFRSQVHP